MMQRAVPAYWARNLVQVLLGHVVYEPADPLTVLAPDASRRSYHAFKNYVHRSTLAIPLPTRRKIFAHSGHTLPWRAQPLDWVHNATYIHDAVHLAPQRQHRVR